MASELQRAAAAGILASSARVDRARPVGEHVLAVPIEAPDGRAVVTAWWADSRRVSNDALDLLDDAARSLSLALEREALEQANAEAASLRRSHQLQQEFLSRLNHELRTPLTAIQGYASTLRQPDVTWDESSQQRFLDSIASESARMGRLVGDLLDFSAIDSGVLRLVPDWCDLGLVLDAARGLRDRSTAWADRRRRLQPRSHPSGPTTTASSRSSSTCSRTRSGTPSGSPGWSSPPRSIREDRAVGVRVSDDGPGLGPGGAERLFLAHERGSAQGPGAGLGLAIARGIVRAHSGSICLEPTETGATVLVELPLEPDDAFDNTDMSDPVDVGRGRSATVRDGERHPRPRRRGRSATSSTSSDPTCSVRGFEVVVSRSGSDVIELLRANEPDIVLLDLMLPGVDGFDLCRDIRAESPVGIVVVSARRGEQDKVRALNLGADDYLTKPFGVDELLARITALLRRSRAGTAAGAERTAELRRRDHRPRGAARDQGTATPSISRRPSSGSSASWHWPPASSSRTRPCCARCGDPDYETETEYTRVYVRRLRAKLEDPDGPALIATEPRAGYRMAMPD